MHVSNTTLVRLKELEKGLTRVQVELEDVASVLEVLSKRLMQMAQVQELQAMAIRRLSQ